MNNDSENKITTTDKEERKCLVVIDSHWLPAKIIRENEDNTFNIEFDSNKSIFPWYGITLDRISINDRQLWYQEIENLASDPSKMTKLEFVNALSVAGYRISRDLIDNFWIQQCQELFNIEDKNANNYTLNRDESYQMLIRGGCSAKQFSKIHKKELEYQKFYVNQIRMGGRQPSEFNRSITMNDAISALGFQDIAVDNKAIACLNDLQENNNIVIPTNLKYFLSITNIKQAVFDSHPNNPRLRLPGAEEFQFQKNLSRKNQEIDGEFALTIMTRNNDYVWNAVFNNNEEDARIYITWEDDYWVLTAPTIAMFFWDLAQTGLVWKRDNDGNPMIKTDIGVIPLNKV